MRLAIPLSALVALCFWANHGLAQSQPWLEDRRSEKGIGVAVGDFEVHPGLAGEVGFDTNFFQGANRETRDQFVGEPVAARFQPVQDGNRFGDRGLFDEPTTGAYRFRITPSLTLQSRGARDGERSRARPMDLRATIAASYNELIATKQRFSEELSHQRFVSADAGVVANVLPQRPWGMKLEGKYSRAVQPVNDPAAPPGFDRSTFVVGSAVEWRPGGELLHWSLGYKLTYVHFEEAAFADLSSARHAANLTGKWKFLPRTSLIYRGSYSYLAYPDGSNRAAGAPLSSVIGLHGLLTDHFGILVSAGWKSLFFSAQEEFQGVVGNAQLTWYPDPDPNATPDDAAVGLSSVKVGYRRDATPAYLGNFVQSDAIYTKGSYVLGGAVLVSADLGFQRLSRPEIFFRPDTRQTEAFSEYRANLAGFLEYRLSDTFGVNATLRYSTALTDREIPLSSDSSQNPIGYDDITFRRLETWVGVRWFL